MYSSGKTFSVIGKEETTQHGSAIRASEDIFQFIEQENKTKPGSEYQVGLSYFLLNDSITIDLLADIPKENEITTTILHGGNDLQSCIQKSEQLRKSHNNVGKDREIYLQSHTFILITLYKSCAGVIDVFGKIQFVELANSEQAVAGKKKIAKALAANFNSLASRLVKHSFYLDSNDHLDDLQNCLNETMLKNTKVLFVCCVGPSIAMLSTSLPSLKFASKIKESLLNSDENIALTEVDECIGVLNKNIKILENVNTENYVFPSCISDGPNVHTIPDCKKTVWIQTHSNKIQKSSETFEKHDEFNNDFKEKLNFGGESNANESQYNFQISEYSSFQKCNKIETNSMKILVMNLKKN